VINSFFSSSSLCFVVIVVCKSLDKAYLNEM
jgi:hypothetical protein